MSPALLQARPPPHRYDHIDLESDKLSGNLAEALGTSLRPTILDRQGATLDPTEFAQSLDKGGLALAIDRTRVGTQISDGRHLPRLLRARRDGPSSGSAAEQQYELAALQPRDHSITSSAIASSLSGTVRPSAFAVL